MDWSALIKINDGAKVARTFQGPTGQAFTPTEPAVALSGLSGSLSQAPEQNGIARGFGRDVSGRFCRAAVVQNIRTLLEGDLRPSTIAAPAGRYCPRLDDKIWS